MTHDPAGAADDLPEPLDTPPDASGPAPAQGDLEARLRDAEDRLMRSQAELENFRKRSQRELDDARRYREIDLLRDLLPVPSSTTWSGPSRPPPVPPTWKASSPDSASPESRSRRCS